MPRHRSLHLVLLSAALPLALASRSAEAQSLWLDPRVQQGVSLELLKPNFDGPDQTALTTSAVFVSFRARAGANLSVVGELPLARYAPKSGFFGTSQNTVGNPYLGLETKAAKAPVTFEFGARLPLASDQKDEANPIGVFSDIDRWEAFLPKYAPVTANVTYRYTAPSGFTVKLRAGPSVWINTDNQDSEMLAAYSLLLGYQSSAVALSGGLTGRAIITESNMSFGERTLHQLGAAVTVGSGAVRPGVQLRLPLDQDMTDILDYVVTLHVSVVLR